jgi:hypothetical protein
VHLTVGSSLLLRTTFEVMRHDSKELVNSSTVSKVWAEIIARLTVLIMEDNEMPEATASPLVFPQPLVPSTFPPPLVLSMFPPPPLQVPPRPQKRAPKIYTKEEWEAQRGIIEQLYITEKKTLEEVTEFLEHNHGFYATYAWPSKPAI